MASTMGTALSIHLRQWINHSRIIALIVPRHNARIVATASGQHAALAVVLGRVLFLRDGRW